MFKHQIEPDKEFAQNHYIDRDTAHDFRQKQSIAIIFA
jgi:hypothetical protein